MPFRADFYYLNVKSTLNRKDRFCRNKAGPSLDFLVIKHYVYYIKLKF